MSSPSGLTGKTLPLYPEARMFSTNLYPILAGLREAPIIATLSGSNRRFMDGLLNMALGLDESHLQLVYLFFDPFVHEKPVFLKKMQHGLIFNQHFGRET